VQTILLLHGAAGSSEQLVPVANLLSDSFSVNLYNFSGHGGKQIPSEPFSIELFADDVLYFIEKNNLLKHGSVNIFGYSMGGYVALYIARHFPEKINKIFTTATKFRWNEDTSVKESGLLNPEKIAEKVPQFAEQLSRIHSPEDWKEVLRKTSEMMINLGKNKLLTNGDLSMIENEVLLSVGDRDNMVTIEETVEVFRNLKNGKLLILPGTPHPIEKISAHRLALEMKSFFE
jgi:pimeloyl-ACP methyl ester carboxylesterase